MSSLGKIYEYPPIYKKPFSHSFEKELLIEQSLREDFLGKGKKPPLRLAAFARDGIETYRSNLILQE
jgi:hypothetical protein